VYLVFAAIHRYIPSTGYDVYIATFFAWIVVVFLAVTAVAEDPILEPDEQMTVVTRTVTRVIVKDGEAPPAAVAAGATAAPAPAAAQSKPSRPSWRCAEIPDQAFEALGTEQPGKTSWNTWLTRATLFVIKYSEKCPSYTALEKEFPPWLVSKKKYAGTLLTLYDLNRSTSGKKLLMIAREDEIEQLDDSFQRRSERSRQNPQVVSTYQEKRRELKKKARAARELLDVKYTDEVKQRSEAKDIVLRFLGEYADHTKHNTGLAPLKQWVRALPAKDKPIIKKYVQEAIQLREYPRADLFPKKDKRAPASLSPRESRTQAALQILLWEIE
jgi:hypothetical protein